MTTFKGVVLFSMAFFATFGLINCACKANNKTSTLGFVFDTTGSMSSELSAVKAAAVQILHIIADAENSPIANFVFTPFNDPEFGPTTVITESEVLHQTLNNIVVNGGGDCPELALSGLKQAIEAGLPNSYYYLITDASAKDIGLVDEVVDLVMKKKSQVTFLLTSTCYGKADPGYLVYETIAEASSGQVYDLIRSEVPAILSSMEDALEFNKISLSALVSVKGSGLNMDIFVDITLTKVTVTVSGSSPQLIIKDPSGAEITDPGQIIELVNLPNLKTFNILKPGAGRWTVTHGSSSSHTVKISGISDVNFEHGFFTEDISKISNRPLQNTLNTLVIDVCDRGEKLKIITAVQIVDVSGGLLFELTVTKLKGSGHMYITTSAIFPNELFYIVIKGLDILNNIVQRTGTTTIQSQEIVEIEEDISFTVEPSIEEMQIHHSLEVGKTIILRCIANGAPTPDVYWYLPNGSYISKESNYSSRIYMNATDLVIQNSWFDDSGRYTCSAKNSVGDTQKETTVLVGQRPYFMDVLKNIIRAPNGKLTVVIHMGGIPRPNITWYHEGTILTGAERTEDGSTYTISNLEYRHEGLYFIVGSNEFGEVSSNYTITLKSACDA